MPPSIWDRLKEVSDQQTRRRRRTPVARSAPRPRGTAPGPVRMPGDPGYGTGPDIRRRSPPGSTSSRVRVNPTTGRVTQPRYRRPAPVDPEYAAIRRDVSRARRAPVERLTGVQQAGFDPSRYIGTGGRSIPGFIKNLSRGALDIVTSVPASAQLVGEAALYPVVAGYNLATGNSNPTARRTERALRTHLDAAGAGIAEDYKYRWGPLFEGEFGRFGARFYEDPLPTILDVAGGKAAVGRAPNVVRRATRAVAPESRAGMRASRALSTLSAEERAQVARIFGTDIEPGPGGRYRPPRTVTSRVARPEEGKPNIGERTIEVPRRPYSGDAIARARQRASDRLRERVAPRVERFAESRQMASGTRASGRTRLSAQFTRPLTSEAKYARVQRRQTRDIQDLFRAKAEVEQARTMPDASKAIGKLRRDKNVAGREMPGLSVEEAAFALHRMDILGDVTDGPRGRGGLTARQLRDQAVRRWEGGQRAARAGDTRTEVARQQLDAIRQVPDELLELTDMKNPAVRRVRAAVDEARKLDVESQRKSVEAGVVKTRTVAEAASRDSAIAVGGARWGGDAIRAVTTRARKKTRGLKRRIASAEKRGDRAEVKRLKEELARHIRNTKGRIEAIRRDATKDTPELRKAREQLAEAEKSLAAEKGKVATRRTLRRMYRAGKTAGKAEVRLKSAARMKTSPRRQPQILSPRDIGRRSGPAKVERGVSVYLPAGSSGARTSGGIAKGVRVGDHIVVNINNRGGKPVYVVAKFDGDSQIDSAYRVNRPLKEGGAQIAPEKGMARLTFDKDFHYPQEVARFDKQADAIAYAQSLASKQSRPVRVVAPGEPRPRGITPGQGKQFAAKLKGEGEAYKIRVRHDGASATKIAAATRARDSYFKRLRKMERDALGFTSPRRPELVGQRGVYVPDTPADKRVGFTGPRRAGRFSGPDQARQSQGRLKGRLGMDLNPSLVLHQARRATENYTGTISAKALDELIASAAYIDPRTGKFLTGNRLRLLSSTDAERVALVHKGNLEKALKRLDTLDEGDFLPEDIARAAVLDDLPEGANASDYIAIHKDAADVWREAMTSSSTFLRGYDKGLNYWKGGLLALSPRWYVNNMFGLGLQYAVMAGTDIRSIVKANRNKGIRRAMETRSPQAIKDTLASDLTGSRDIPSIMAFGFRTNAKIEEAWRRAAFYNRAKKRLRDERGKFRDLSDAEIARAIENMPESMARDIINDVEFFIGNYRKFNKAEREVFKRAIPFYSWLRVIGRLTLALPFRSPVRAAAMAVLETASTAGINPNDKALPYYMRGSLRFGDKAVPTWSINPFQTLAPMVAAAGARQPAGAMTEEGLGWVSPLAQLVVSQATGVNNFGRGVSTPPGTAMFGQDPEAMNPVTGLPESQRARIPIDEALLQSAIPGQAGVIRKLASAGRTPYDTTRTIDVIADAIQSIGGGERDPLLYRPESSKKGRTPAGINWITSGVGVPIYNQDDGALTREARAALREFKAEMKKLERQRKKARR